MIKNGLTANHDTPKGGELLSFTATIDLTRVRRERDLILRESRQYQVSLNEGELPMSINFDGRIYVIDLTADALQGV